MRAAARTRSGDTDADTHWAIVARGPLTRGLATILRLSKAVTGGSESPLADSFVAELCDELRRTAVWRERKQRAYPDDLRNTDAAEACRRLADALTSVDDANPLLNVARSLSVLIDAALSGESTDDVTRDERMERFMEPWLEAQGAFFRDIGFRDSYRDVHEFLAAYGDLLTEAVDDLLDDGA